MNRADTTRLLDLVQQYDQRAITADLISEWHHQLGSITYTAAEEAIHIHHKTAAFAITPADVRDIAQQIQARTTSRPAPKRRARMGTYQVTGAINDPCARCGAEPGETCTRDGHETAAPCVTRLLGRPIGNAQEQLHGGRVA